MEPVDIRFATEENSPTLETCLIQLLRNLPLENTEVLPV